MPDIGHLELAKGSKVLWSDTVELEIGAGQDYALISCGFYPGEQVLNGAVRLTKGQHVVHGHLEVGPDTYTDGSAKWGWARVDVSGGGVGTADWKIESLDGHALPVFNATGNKARPTTTLEMTSAVGWTGGAQLWTKFAPWSNEIMEVYLAQVRLGLYYAIAIDEVFSGSATRRCGAMIVGSIPQTDAVAARSFRYPLQKFALDFGGGDVVTAVDIPVLHADWTGANWERDVQSWVGDGQAIPIVKDELIYGRTKRWVDLGFGPFQGQTRVRAPRSDQQADTDEQNYVSRTASAKTDYPHPLMGDRYNVTSGVMTPEYKLHSGPHDADAQTGPSVGYGINPKFAVMAFRTGKQATIKAFADNALYILQRPFHLAEGAAPRTTLENRPNARTFSGYRWLVNDSGASDTMGKPKPSVAIPNQTGKVAVTGSFVASDNSFNAPSGIDFTTLFKAKRWLRFQKTSGGTSANARWFQAKTVTATKVIFETSPASCVDEGSLSWDLIYGLDHWGHVDHDPAHSVYREAHYAYILTGNRLIGESLKYLLESRRLGWPLKLGASQSIAQERGFGRVVQEVDLSEKILGLTTARTAMHDKSTSDLIPQVTHTASSSVPFTFNKSDNSIELPSGTWASVDVGDRITIAGSGKNNGIVVVWKNQGTKLFCLEVSKGGRQDLVDETSTSAILIVSESWDFLGTQEWYMAQARAGVHNNPESVFYAHQGTPANAPVSGHHSALGMFGVALAYKFVIPDNVRLMLERHFDYIWRENPPDGPTLGWLSIGRWVLSTDAAWLDPRTATALPNNDCWFGDKGFANWASVCLAYFLLQGDPVRMRIAMRIMNELYDDFIANTSRGFDDNYLKYTASLPIVGHSAAWISGSAEVTPQNIFETSGQFVADGNATINVTGEAKALISGTGTIADQTQDEFETDGSFIADSHGVINVTGEAKAVVSGSAVIGYHSRKLHITTASQSYEIGFPYLKPSHISVTLDGVSLSRPTAWDVSADGLRIELVAAPAENAPLEIRRNTPHANLLQEFHGAGVLTPEAFNQLVLQVFYFTQEVEDRL